MSLFSDFVHVDNFGPDDEYQSGEDVEYITLDLGAVEPQLVPQTATYRLAGLDTPTPFLQLSGSTFRGEHTSLLGSEILFVNGRDDASPARRFVVPHATTSKRIRFSEVQVIPKPEPGEDAAAEELRDLHNQSVEMMSASQKQRMRRQKRASKIFERSEDHKGPGGRRKSERANANAKAKRKLSNDSDDNDGSDADWSENNPSLQDDMLVDEGPAAGPSRRAAD